jgi:type IV secretion system protein VirB10
MMVEENQQQDGAGKLPPDATGVRQPEVEAPEEGEGPSGGVRRLNKKAIIMIAGALGVAFLGFMAMQMFGGDDASKEGASAEDDSNVAATEDGAASVDTLENESKGSEEKPADQEAKLKEEAAKSEKMKKAEAMQAAMEKRLEEKEEEAEEEEGSEQKDPWEEARKSARRQHAQRFHKQALAADTSAVFAKIEEGSAADEREAEEGSAARSRPESAAARLARARRQVEGSGSMAGVGGSRRGQDDSKQAFLKNAGGEPTQNVHRLQEPVSEYIVQAGTVLPLVLETGISSDLPGYLKARVSRAVYDTPTGQYLLIPAGAVVLGRYNSEVEFGDERVQVVWTRMIFPNGSSIQLGGIPGVDLSGKTGVTDKVDYHWDRLIGGAVLSTGLAAGAGVAAGPRGGDQPDTPGQSALTAAGKNVSEVGDEIAKRELGVEPTLEIRPGMQMAAIVHQDMVLRPYQEGPGERGRGE